MHWYEKIIYLILTVMLVLCIWRRISTQESHAKLPITQEVAKNADLGKMGDKNGMSLNELMAEENEAAFLSLLEEEQSFADGKEIEKEPSIYTAEELGDYSFLLSHIYNVDESTSTTEEQLDVKRFSQEDFTINRDTGGYEILIYHTHSREAFADSVPGDEGTTIVGMGDYLTSLLTKEGFHVLHHKGEYDVVGGVEDRSQAYARAEPEITALLNDNPDIQIVIDLHRDGVNSQTHLVTEVDGKPTAQIMFFNGLSYSKQKGNITYLPNPYIDRNLALTYQMKIASDTIAPGFARKIYLKSLRFNLNLHPGAMLIEAGAQTNTVEEERNAMEVLARILSYVLH